MILISLYSTLNVIIFLLYLFFVNVECLPKLLKWTIGFSDFHLNDTLKNAITEAREEYKQKCKSLDIDYLIFNKIGKNMCKKLGVSPDAVMQLGFQVNIFRNRFLFS